MPCCRGLAGFRIGEKPISVRMAGANKSAGGGRGEMMMPPPGQFMPLQDGFA